MVFYRKYRPQTIEELDLDSVRERLTSILSAKSLPHAFLFTGPKGLGKTSSARILAKAINCEVNQEARIKKQGKKDNEQSHDSKFVIHDSRIEPCNACEACKSITNGSNLDVIEIDAASNRGIDEIRDLREKIKFTPASLPKKVYIIDEVHMLTNDAFNALLKTLEEPPDHAIFILCTTETEKIPPTIMSRAFHVAFQKPTEAELTRSITRIIDGEKLDIEEAVIKKLYKLSEGSFRDAAKILEDLSFSSDNKKITLALLEKTYKTESIEMELGKLLIALSEKNIQEAMKIVDAFSQKGSDFKSVFETFAGMLHDALMAQAGLGSTNFEIGSLNTQDLKRLLTLVNDNFKNLKFAVLPQIPLELVVVGWCLEEVQNSKLKVQSLKDENKNEKKEEAGTHVVVRTTHVEEKVILENRSEEKKLAEESAAPQKIEITAKVEEKRVADGPEDLFRQNPKPENFMAAFIVAIKRDNNSLAGILRGCRLVEIVEGKIIFETKFKFHKEKMSESKSLTILEKRASEILAEKVEVLVNLTQK